MLGAILASASGAVGGAWFRHSVTGLFPGAVLALIGSLAVGYRTTLWDAPAHRWAVPALMVIGLSIGRLAGLPTRRRIDLPLDRRLGFALCAGFVVRGFWMVSSALLH